MNFFRKLRVRFQTRKVTREVNKINDILWDSFLIHLRAWAESRMIYDPTPVTMDDLKSPSDIECNKE